MSIARTAALLLLFANLIFFAWTREYVGSPGDSSEPERLTAQMSPGKIRIVGTNKNDADASATEPAQTSATSDTGTQAPAVNVAGEAKPASTPATETCHATSELPLDEAEKLKTAIATSGATIAVTLRPLTEVQSYWLRVPPLRNRDEAEKKAAEIKKLGVSDFYVVQDEGPNLNAISLGLFHSEQAAAELRDRLAKKGVRAMDIQVREKTEKAILELRGTEGLLNKPLTELLTKAGARVSECAAH
jgi:hypothetical protein